MPSQSGRRISFVKAAWTVILHFGCSILFVVAFVNHRPIGWLFSIGFIWICWVFGRDFMLLLQAGMPALIFPAFNLTYSVFHLIESSKLGTRENNEDSAPLMWSFLGSLLASVYFILPSPTGDFAKVFFVMLIMLLNYLTLLTFGFVADLRWTDPETESR